MNIFVNGDNCSCESAMSIADLVKKLGLHGKRIAVELNGEIIPKSEHATVQLQESDKLEVVHAIGGG